MSNRRKSKKNNKNKSKESGLIYNTWIDCTDENYWQTERDMVGVIIAGEMYYMDRKNCPYGWNILVRNKAQFFTPAEATIAKHYKEEDE